MSLDLEQLGQSVRDANLAPSVHNTQPTRWRLEADGSVLVLEDVSRRLAVGDPLGRDADVSHGAAIEGFVLAYANKDRSVNVIPVNGAAQAGLRPVARLVVDGGAAANPLYPFVGTRRTYRGAFVKDATAPDMGSLSAEGDVCLVRAPDGIARLAALNDEASLRTFRDAAFRAELVSWMRLSRRHPGWAQDGLNAEAMEMSGLEAAGAGFVLKPGIFETLDKLHLAQLFVAEAGTVKTAQAIALFHRPGTEAPLQTGRRFYRLWLEFTALGLSAAPMAVLADDAETRAIIAREFGIPADRRLITAFRLGVAPKRNLNPKPRLPVSALLV